MSQIDVLDVLSSPKRRNTTLLIEELILQSYGLIKVVSEGLVIVLQPNQLVVEETYARNGVEHLIENLNQVLGK